MQWNERKRMLIANWNSSSVRFVSKYPIITNVNWREYRMNWNWVEKTVADLHVERAQLADQLTKKDIEIEAHICKFDAARLKSRADFDEMSAMIDELADRRQMRQLQNDLIAAREQSNLLAEQNHQLHADLSAVNGQKSELTSELQRQLNAIEMEKMNLAARLASVTAEFEACRQRATALDDELVRVHDELRQAVDARLMMEANAMQRERAIGARFKVHATEYWYEFDWGWDGGWEEKSTYQWWVLRCGFFFGIITSNKLGRMS